MREDDDDEIGHYLGLLRRIIILVAVIIAVPVILWTITAFIRYQVVLPKVSIFPNPLATASTNAQNRPTIAEPTQQQSMPLQPTDPQEAKQTDRAAPEGSSFVEHQPDAPPSAPSASQAADTSSALAAISNSATSPVSSVGTRAAVPYSSAPTVCAPIACPTSIAYAALLLPLARVRLTVRHRISASRTAIFVGR